MLKRIQRWRTHPAFIEVTPVVTTVALESANVQQLWRMWTEQSALGQSIGAWIAVQFALWLWLNFYFAVCPEKKFAIYGTCAGIGLNMAVILTVAHFRHLGGL